MSPSAIASKIEQLPPESQKEVEDFIEFIAQRSLKEGSSMPSRKFRFDWAGCLAEYNDKYTAVELQKKILEEM